MESAVVTTSSLIELDVEMTCESCVGEIRRALEQLEAVKDIQIDLGKQQVVVETVLPHSSIIRAIEDTGRRAVIKGYGTPHRAHLGAAVVEITSPIGVMGVVRFLQASNDVCIIDGTVDGLSEGEHGLHIHEYGDLSQGCDSVGDHFNPRGARHGGPGESQRHYGDLGNITADANGRAVFRKEDVVVKVWDIIGRSLVVTQDEDDLGKGSSPTSKIDGNSGKRLACGIIARSAGLFENPKRICLCEGTTVWDEREKATKSRLTAAL